MVAVSSSEVRSEGNVCVSCTGVFSQPSTSVLLGGSWVKYIRSSSNVLLEVEHSIMPIYATEVLVCKFI